MFAQIGLSDPTGGIFVLLAGAVAGALGLTLFVMGVIGLFRPAKPRRAPLLLAASGLMLTSPALWLAFVLFTPDIPRDKSWDFSASRSTAQLQEARESKAYYYQGNIRSTIKLPAGRQWAGDAYLVVFTARAGEVREIHWQSRSAEAVVVYERTKAILAGLGLPGQELDAWHAKVSGGGQASFSATVPPADGPGIEVMVRGSTAEGAWATHVNVRWPETASRKAEGESRK